MAASEWTPAFVQEYLRVLAGLEIDADEARALLPAIQSQAASLAHLDQFALSEVRSSLAFDPTVPYR
jgi:hypothetical protein